MSKLFNHVACTALLHAKINDLLEFFAFFYSDRSRCINHGKRRNTTGYTLLAMAAKPWFDPAADGEGGGVGGVIPALEAESDSVTIKAR